MKVVFIVVIKSLIRIWLWICLVVEFLICCFVWGIGSLFILLRLSFLIILVGIKLINRVINIVLLWRESFLFWVGVWIEVDIGFKLFGLAIVMRGVRGCMGGNFILGKLIGGGGVNFMVDWVSVVRVLVLMVGLGLGEIFFMVVFFVIKVFVMNLVLFIFGFLVKFFREINVFVCVFVWILWFVLFLLMLVFLLLLN